MLSPEILLSHPLCVAIPHTHGESVDVFVELVEECNTLDNHVVHLVNVELHLGT